MKNTRSSHKTYRRDGGVIDDATYCKVINDFNRFIMDKVFEGHTVKLPQKLGAILIKGRKIKPSFDAGTGRSDNLPIDFGETNKLWARCPECKERKQMVYHLNEHTNGIRYKFSWSRERMIVKNKLFYNILFTRSNKRRLAKLIKEGKEYYVEPTKQEI